MHQVKIYNKNGKLKKIIPPSELSYIEQTSTKHIFSRNKTPKKKQEKRLPPPKRVLDIE